jgi:hypothetical protein
MPSRMPPVPPAGRSDKGPGGTPKGDKGDAKAQRAPENLAEQDRQGNVAQNTTHQGYQQGR